MPGKPPTSITDRGWQWGIVPGMFTDYGPAGEVRVQWMPNPIVMWGEPKPPAWYVTLWFGGEMDPSDPLDTVDMMSVLAAVSEAGGLAIWLNENFPTGPTWLSP